MTRRFKLGLINYVFAVLNFAWFLERLFQVMCNYVYLKFLSTFKFCSDCLSRILILPPNDLVTLHSDVRYHSLVFFSNNFQTPT